MKISIKEDENKSYHEVFLPTIAYWEGVRRRLEESLKIKFTEKDIKNAKDSLNSKSINYLKELHSQNWKKYKEKRNKLKKGIKSALKDFNIQKMVNDVARYTNIKWKIKKINIYLICKNGDQGFKDGIGIGYLREYDFDNENIKIKFIQGIIHELIHCNTVDLIENENDDAREISTVIITNIISKELGIKGVQRFEENQERYNEGYDKLKLLYKGDFKELYNNIKRGL